MKVTSEQVLKLFGLKVGDKIEINLQMYGYTTLKLENRNSGLVWYGDDDNPVYKFTYILDKEYKIIKPKPKLTEDEKVILRNLHEEYKWICRLYDDTLYITDAKPQSSQSQWGFANCQYAKSIPFENIFKFIKWEDEEPYNIEELLKGNE